MMKIIITLLIFLVAYCTMQGQSVDEIHWKTWPELERALNENPKPVFLFFNADWCAYCKKIERKVFTKPEVIQKLNADYYALEMDVERTDTITFEGIQFTNEEAITKRNGVHKLPLLLASRKNTPFSLPATILLDKDFIVRKRIFEYYTSKQLLHLLSK